MRYIREYINIYKNMAIVGFFLPNKFEEILIFFSSSITPHNNTRKRRTKKAKKKFLLFICLLSISTNILLS